MRKMTSGVWIELVAVLLAEVFKEMLHRKKHCWQRGVANLHQWPHPKKDTSPPTIAVPFVATRHSTTANLSMPSCEHRGLFFKRCLTYKIDGNLLLFMSLKLPFEDHSTLVGFWSHTWFKRVLNDMDNGDRNSLICCPIWKVLGSF